MTMLSVVPRGYFSSEIKLSDIIATGMPSSVQPPVQILRTGKFNHPKYGEFEITPVTLAEMKKNFDAKIRGIDVALDYFHQSDQAASGWIRELFLSEDENELWGNVEWTPKATKMLSEREVRYFSPDFAFKWTDPETDVTYNNVLFGGGLTNRPFVKDMAAIVAAENKGDEMKLEELAAQVKKLSEDGGDLAKKHADLQAAHSDLLAKHSALQKKMDEMAEKPAAPAPAEAPADDGSDANDEPADLPAAKNMIAGMKKKLAEYSENAKKAEEAKQMAEKESKFAVLLSEGKACAAQKDSFIKGDMESFIKLAEPVNLKGKGHGGSGDDAKDSGDRSDRVLKLAEEKVKADPKLELHQAIKLANAEIKA